MDSLPYLCRFQYAETAEYLTSLTDPLIAAYQAFQGSAAGQVRCVAGLWLPRQGGGELQAALSYGALNQCSMAGAYARLPAAAAAACLPLPLLLASALVTP